MENINGHNEFDETKREYAEEIEHLYDDNNEPEIYEPYDPMKVDIISQTFSLQSILDRLENNEIDLNPNFQRKENLWKQQEQSRLIESILIRVPLPAFYFDCRNDDNWTIVDGLQRISTLNNFVVRKKDDEFKLYLTNLEYLKEYNGKSYEDLPRKMQRRIRECQIFCFCIRPGTPDDITISIFKRINTGGMPLTLPEIRNAVYRGEAANLVRDMAQSQEFIMATRNRISSSRMADRDLTARFLAFYILGYDAYDGDMNGFLEKGMEFIKYNYSKEQCLKVLHVFKNSMNVCIQLFEECAFRKKGYGQDNHFGPLNKSLFECTSVCVAKLSEKEKQILVDNRNLVFNDYIKLFDTSFFATISNATGVIENVRYRHEKLNQFLHEQITRFI